MSNEVHHKEIAPKFLIALRNRDWYLLKAILTEDLVWTLPVRV